MAQSVLATRLPRHRTKASGRTDTRGSPTRSSRWTGPQRGLVLEAREDAFEVELAHPRRPRPWRRRGTLPASVPSHRRPAQFAPGPRPLPVRASWRRKRVSTVAQVVADAVEHLRALLDLAHRCGRASGLRRAKARRTSRRRAREIRRHRLAASEPLGGLGELLDGAGSGCAGTGWAIRISTSDVPTIQTRKMWLLEA